MRTKSKGVQRGNMSTFFVSFSPCSLSKPAIIQTCQQICKTTPENTQVLTGKNAVPGITIKAKRTRSKGVERGKCQFFFVSFSPCSLSKPAIIQTCQQICKTTPGLTEKKLFLLITIKAMRTKSKGVQRGNMSTFFVSFSPCSL
jgi:hypothetical protein